MKQKRRILILLLAAAMLLAGNGCTNSGEQEKTQPTSQPTTAAETTVANEHMDGVSTSFYGDMLTPTQKQAYDQILDSVSGHPQKIQFPFILSEEEMKQVFDAVCNDNPQLHCLNGGFSYGANETACAIAPKYNCTGEECAKKTIELERAIDEALSNIPQGADDYGKELALHDWLVSHCENISTAKGKTTAYDAIVGCRADTAGYARAVQLLFTRAGLKSHIVTGTVQDLELNTVEHMWNIVEIGGSDYHLDANLNDPVNSLKSYLQHFYFNLSDEEIAVDHFDFFAPSKTCKETKENYYRREGLMYSEYNDAVKAEIKDMVREMAMNHEYFIELRFDNPYAYVEGKKHMVDSNGIYKIIKELNGKLGENKLSRDMLIWSYTERYNIIRFEFTYVNEQNQE